MFHYFNTTLSMSFHSKVSGKIYYASEKISQHCLTKYSHGQPWLKCKHQKTLENNISFHTAKSEHLHPVFSRRGEGAFVCQLSQVAYVNSQIEVQFEMGWRCCKDHCKMLTQCVQKLLASIVSYLTELGTGYLYNPNTCLLYSG